MSELAPTRKAEGEALKSFLSRSVDKVRHPYARVAEPVPRQCGFIATTNELEFLRDTTGGRRFWPVACGKSVDLEGLKRDRDQLFAEALVAFKSGEVWHLSPEMEELAREAQAEAQEEDPWEEAIVHWLDNRGEDFEEFDDDEGVELCHRVTTSELLSNALGVGTERQGGASSKRVGAIMRKLGWAQKRDGRSGPRYWARPQ